MANLSPQQEEIIRRSQQSVSWFLANFGRLKHPSAGVLPFEPFTYQKHAITCFRKHRLNIFRKCRQCFRGDQMVWTPTGPRRIDLIREGDLVYSFNNETQRLDIVPVQETFDNGEMEVCEVKSKTGHTSVATLDHNYFTYGGEIEAQNLTTDDRLLEVCDWPRTGFVANESEAILLGYMIGDGYYGNSNQSHFTNTCWRYLLEYQKHFAKLFGLRRPIKPHNRDEDGKITSYRIYYSNKIFWKWVEDLGIAGQTREEKEIPDVVFDWENDSIALFLNRLFAADGWYSGGNCNEVGIGQESMRLLHQIKQLLSRFGINSRVYPATEQSMPKLRIYGGTDFKLFVENIGIFNKKPRKEITKGFFFNRKKGEIKRITQKGETAKVYDISVPPHNNYIVDGAVVHNSGISKISGAFATWFAMFHPHKTILIVSRRNEDAMGFLRDHVVFLYEHLPPWMKEVWKPVKQNEHEIIFPNGSRIQSLTSHPEVLRSNASSLNIIDESAFINGMDTLWAAGWPTLQHGGNVIVISTCVAPDTYIWTENGLCQIKDLEPDEYDGFDEGYYHADYNGPKVLGRDGLEKPTKFYKRPKEATKIITTRGRYKTEVSTTHRILSVKNTGEIDYTYSTDLKVGDYLPIERGRFIFGNNDKLDYVDDKTGWRIDTIDGELAYLLGVITAEGCLTSSSINVASGDLEIREKFLNNKFGWKFTIRKKQPYSMDCNNSAGVYRFLEWIGFERCKAPLKQIPKRLFQCSANVIRHYLMGLFDGDGFSRKRDGEVGLVSTSSELLVQVRQLLSNFGIICKEEWRGAYEKEFNLNNRSYVSQCLPHGRLLIRSGEARKYYERIGFGLARKQKNYINTRPSIEYIPHAVELVRKFRIEAQMSITDMNLCGIQNNVLFGRKNRKNQKLSKDLVLFFLSRVPNNKRHYGSYNILKQLANSDYYYDDIVEIMDSESELMDFTIPNGHSFIGCTFVHHQTNGIGNWYWSTWTDAEAGINGFNPIMVNWWDMDWKIEYKDPLSRQMKRIAPRDGIRKCVDRHEIDKFGPYWSPWLQEQYDALQEQGDAWKFDQEIMASFVGSGHTILTKQVLAQVQTTIKDPVQKVKGYQTYVHPVSGLVEDLSFDFTDPDEGLWIWETPVVASPTKRRGNVVIDHGTKAHAYVMGVDIATGKGRDYSAIEVFDVDTMEQVAEFMAHCLPRELVKYIDRIGRWYNSALAVIERNNGGDTLIDSLRFDTMYPRVWRKKEINDKPTAGNSKTQRALKVSQYGFSTSQASKPTLNKFLQDFISEKDGEGYKIFSTRLLKQFQTYVRKRDRTGRDTNKTEAEDGAGNFDDLVIACGLALIGTSDAFVVDAGNLIPVGSNGDFTSQTGPVILTDAGQVAQQRTFADQGGPSLMMPMKLAPDELPDVSAQRHIDAFTMELGGIPMSQGGPIVVPNKFYYDRKDG